MKRALTVFATLAVLSGGCVDQQEAPSEGSDRQATTAEQTVMSEGSGSGGSKIAEGIYLLRGRFVEGSQPDGNSVILEGSDGLIVVDTGRHAEHTRRILDFARQTERPIRAIVNTHWHLDHTGGNVLLRDELPEVTVHGTPAIEDARDGFLADYARQIEEYLPAIEDPNARTTLETELELVRSAERLAPTELVESSATESIAGRSLELNVERDAVTAADLWIVDIDTGVVIAGDLVTLPVPLLDTAVIDGWVQALQTIASRNPRIVIPGHGRVLDGSELAQYVTAFTNLVGCGESDRPDEACADGWIEDTHGLLAPDEEAFARRLLAYYVPRHIRR